MKKILAWIKQNILGIEPRRRKKGGRKKSARRPAKPRKKPVPSRPAKVLKAKKVVKPVKKLPARPVPKKKALKPVKPLKVLKQVPKKPLKPAKAVKLPASKGKAGKAEPKESLVGEITHYFGNIEVAVIKISRGRLMVGDPLRIKGHTTDFRMTIGSMQIDRKPVDVAGRGQEIGVKVPEPVRAGDLVFKPEV